MPTYNNNHIFKSDYETKINEFHERTSEWTTNNLNTGWIRLLPTPKPNHGTTTIYRNRTPDQIFTKNLFPLLLYHMTCATNVVSNVRTFSFIIINSFTNFIKAKINCLIRTNNKEPFPHRLLKVAKTSKTCYSNGRGRD